MSGNQTPQPQQIGFTRIDCFLEQIKTNPSGLQEKLEQSRFGWLILSCDACEWNDHDCLPHERPKTMLYFCGSEVARAGLNVFPHPSQLWFIIDKSKRDPPLLHLMVPFVTTTAAGSWSSTCENAELLLLAETKERVVMLSNTDRDDQELSESIQQEIRSNGLVAKMMYGSGSYGVLFFMHVQGAWTIDGSKTIGDPHDLWECSKENRLRFQQFWPQLHASELRIYVTRRGGIDNAETSVIYSAWSRRNEENSVTWEDPQRSLTECNQASIKQVINDGIDALSSCRGGVIWGGTKNHCLRFDIFCCDDFFGTGKQHFLNEIEIFPMAQTFLTDGSASQKAVQQLADPMAKHLASEMKTSLPRKQNSKRQG